MYDVSQEYKTAIRRQTRKFEWQGTITTTAGKESERGIVDWDRTYFLTKYYCF